ncbi:endo-beta-N-acetylglucosaminidase [Actinopolymorpha alba]|uniref:endo-beta-N-acetylglucosaminidase n=1 Tax=Actinopolymorpha alba TaxID=533267 RepID=UPI00036F1D91|nr:hypothetical protein [Actinopolymorpha alba]
MATTPGDDVPPESRGEGGVDRRAFLRYVSAGAVGATALAAGTPSASAEAPPVVTGAGPLAGLTGTLAELSPMGLPFLHGYDAPAIKAWSPDTDPFAKYFRSRVPLARRIPTFAPTQAHPGLDDRPRLMTLANDYVEPGNFALAHRYGYHLQAYALRFWQYVDMFGSWHGLPVNGEYGKEDPRFGTINLPNPAWTDAAHRNGVKSLGCWFWPRPENFAEFVEKRPDGSFPVADKLVEMAAYFGFDGYFINQEAAITLEQTALLHELFSYLARTAPPGFHVQWYDSLTMAGTVRYQNEFNATNSPWIVDADGTRVCSSIFLNYWWSQERLRRSHDHAVALGLDPYEVVFAGTEAGLNNFSQPYDPRWIFPEGEAGRTSWAFLGTEFPWRLAPGDKSTVEGQRAAYAFERQWWSGPKQDPAQTGRSLPPTGTDKGNPERWDGVAHTVVEKSVVGTFPFVTRFNAGTGEKFFVDGGLVAERPWFNIGIQDVLPTWQWWLRSADGAPAERLTVDYDYTRAYDGGTSLAISGALAADDAVELRLYKTRLPVVPDVHLSLTYTTGRAGAASHLRVGLVFTDAPGRAVAGDLHAGDVPASTPIWLDAGRTGLAGWNRQVWSLAPYAGRTIAAVYVGFHSPTAVDDYTVHLGEFRLERRGDADRPPAKPRGFVVEDARVADGGATAFLAWELAPARVWYYDLFRLGGPGGSGAREWVGRTYDEVYAVPGLERRAGETETVLELVAVSPGGAASPPARLAFRWP